MLTVLTLKQFFSGRSLRQASWGCALGAPSMQTDVIDVGTYDQGDISYIVNDVGAYPNANAIATAY